LYIRDLINRDSFKYRDARYVQAVASANVGAVMPAPNTNPATRGSMAVPFRKATVERTEILPSDNLVLSAGAQRIEKTIEGSGYVYGILLNVVATAAANAAAVTFSEDGPYNVLDTVVFRDVNGEVVNTTGYELFLANLINKQYAVRHMDQSTVSSQVVGAVGAGGSFNFWLRVPLGLNRRDLVGILGNQDRAQKYALRNDLSGSAIPYGVPPTTPATVVVNKYYENYAVPLPTSPTGAPQEIYPPSFGTIHFTTSTTSDSAPAGPGLTNHYLRRIGNTVRWIALIFRSNGSRATADANAPTVIRAKFGEDTAFNESYQYRRAIMYERFGFDLPLGVLVYDALHDFQAGAGNEIGDDYFSTQALVNAQYEISYPAGFGSTNNSLKFLTDDLIFVPPTIGAGASG